MAIGNVAEGMAIGTMAHRASVSSKRELYCFDQ
jgi:hypothetical protein